MNSQKREAGGGRGTSFSKTTVGSSLLQGSISKGSEGVTLVHMLFLSSFLCSFLKRKAFALGKIKSKITLIPHLTSKLELEAYQ